MDSITLPLDLAKTLPLDLAMLDQTKNPLSPQNEGLTYGPEVVNQSDKYKLQSLVFAKEKELALALVKVAELTSQLEKLRAACSAEDEKVDTSGSFRRMVQLGILRDDNKYSMDVCRRLDPDLEYNNIASTDYLASKTPHVIEPTVDAMVEKSGALNESIHDTPAENGINGSMAVYHSEELPRKQNNCDDLQWKTSLTVTAKIYTTMIVPKILTDSISFVTDEPATESQQPKTELSLNNTSESFAAEAEEAISDFAHNSSAASMTEKAMLTAAAINGDAPRCALKSEPANNNRLKSNGLNGAFSYLNGIQADLGAVQLSPARVNDDTRSTVVSQVVINNGASRLPPQPTISHPSETKYINAEDTVHTKSSNLVKRNSIELVNSSDDQFSRTTTAAFTDVAPSVVNNRNEPPVSIRVSCRHHQSSSADGQHGKQTSHHGPSDESAMDSVVGRKVSENDSSLEGSVSSMSSVSSMEEMRSVDTSVDSVNSALSVLLKVAPAVGIATQDVPASPRCAYRYASRSAVSNIYRRKLGVGGSDTYSTNMSQIYGAGNFLGSKRTESVEDTPSPDPNRRFPALVSPFFPPASSQITEDVFADGVEGKTKKNDVDNVRTRCHAPHPVRRMFSGNGPSSLTQMFSLTSPPPTSPNSVTTPLLTPFKQMQHSLSFNEFADSSADDKDSLEFFNTKNVLHLTKSPSFPAATAVRSASITAYIDDQYSAVYGNMSRNAGQVQAGSATSILRSTERRSKQSLAPRRVTFENVSLLLSAAREGELDIVKETLGIISDPSKPNSEGVTALHNAVYGGHCDVAQYLIDQGSNVNAPDDDGWTPLHCAASGNHLNAIRLLVEHGACISARTCDTNETPMQKCPKITSRFEDCMKYFIDAEQQLGVANKGEVYVVNVYESCRPDELSITEGDRIKILRRGDLRETDWWWACSNGKEGYVPKTALATYPKHSA